MRSAGTDVLRGTLFATFFLFAYPAGVSAAQTNPQGEAAALFQQGMTLWKKGDLTGACAKFRDSLGFAPAVATLAKIAECDEKDGKIVTALARYREAKSLNDADSNPARKSSRARAITPRIADLEARAPRMQITLTDWPLGFEVVRNGTPVSRAELGTFAEVDPGAYEIVATAPGYVGETVSVTLAERESKTVSIVWKPVQKPVPTAVPSAVPSSTAPLPSGHGASAGPAPTTPAVSSPAAPARFVLGVLVGGLGVGVLGVAAGYGVDTLQKVAESRKDHDPCPRDYGYKCETLLGQARTSQNIGFALLGVGVGLVGVGVVLLLTAPPPKLSPSSPAPPRVVVRLGPTGLAMTAQW